MGADENNNVPHSKAARHITSLNVFCLISVFQYLDIVDLVNISEVHSAFEEVIRRHVIGQRPFNCDDISDYFSVEQVLRTFGGSIRELQLSVLNLGPTLLRKRMSSSDIALEFIGRYCKKLQKLCLTLARDEPINPDVLHRAGTILSQLQSLEICNSWANDCVKDNVHSILQSCPNLREVKFGGRQMITFESLAQYTQLTSLEVNLFLKNETLFEEILNRNPEIQKLSVIYLRSYYLPVLSVRPRLKCLNLKRYFLQNYDHLTDSLVLMARTNTLVEFDLQLDKYSILNIYYQDMMKRQQIRDALTEFTSLKRISITTAERKDFFLITDIITSLPNVIECTLGGNFIQSDILSVITKNLRILRLAPSTIRFSASFYQKLLRAKNSKENNCLRLFVPKSSLEAYMLKVGDNYKPKQLEIVPF